MREPPPSLGFGGSPPPRYYRAPQGSPPARRGFVGGRDG
jgi:hypothetical protein